MVICIADPIGDLYLCFDTYDDFLTSAKRIATLCAEMPRIKHALNKQLKSPPPMSRLARGYNL